jgi:hypothetical protein
MSPEFAKKKNNVDCGLLKQKRETIVSSGPFTYSSPLVQTVVGWPIWNS